MDNSALLDYSFYFIIYGFLGWIVEVLYTGTLNRHFTNRGFLYSPFLPIYGFGALFIIYFLTPFKSNMFLVFIVGIILTTALEYFTAVVLEHIFHIKWWDYSHYKINFQGRICLRNSFGFGALGLIVIYLVQPQVMNISKMLGDNKEVLIDLFFSCIIIDFYFTLRKLNTLPVRHIHLLNTRSKNIEKEVGKLHEALQHGKFRNEEVNLRVNVILLISLVGGIIALFISNVYYGLIITLVIAIILAAFVKEKNNND